MRGGRDTTTFRAPASYSKRSSASKRRRQSSKFQTNIDDLPDILLVEVVGRLACNKLVFQCKSVSKSWCTLLSDPFFICRFLRLQSDKQSPLLRTLINQKAEKIPPGETLRFSLSFLPLKEEPTVLATYNDLVLCSASEYDQRDYFICNPYTKKWVALPPAPQCHRKLVPVGLICDAYYKDEDSDHHQKVDRQQINLNAEYRCRVVRILRPDKVVEDDRRCILFSKFNVEIFSSETGEWRESVVSTPRAFCYDINSDISFAYNGILYFSSVLSNLFIGLDPFMINNNNTTSSTSTNTNGDDVIDHNYKCRFIEFDEPVEYACLDCLGVNRGCLRMCDFCSVSKTLLVWDLKEEQDQMVVDGAPDGKLSLRHWRGYPLDKIMFPHDDTIINLLAFDPNYEDILYLGVGDEIIMCHIRTLWWAKCTSGQTALNTRFLFPLVLPWWPTPVPRLPWHAHGVN